MSEKSPPFSILAFLKPIAEIAVLLSSMAFTAGWACLYSYYNEFGLGLFDIDIPLATGSVYAIRVLSRSVWPAIIVLISLFMVRFLKPTRFSQLSDFRDIGILGVFLLSLVSVAFVGVRVGHTSARDDMSSDSTQLPAVAFISSFTADNYPMPDCLTSNTLNCRLLGHSKGYYYFFHPIDPSSANIELVSISDKYVKFMRLQRGLK